MVFYFSGTGNSLYVAKEIAKCQNEKIISIAKEVHKNQQQYEYEVDSEESIIFVCPVYAWAPPAIVVDFIKKLKLSNYNKNYISIIITCGEDIGNAIEYIESIFKSNGLKLDSGFSIIAPNNYIIVGDVYDKNLENKNLSKLDDSLVEINKVIKDKKTGIFRVEKGKFPKIKTNFINRLFNDYGINVKKFYANDNCIGCKVCEKVCNGKCITVDKKPIWNGQCTQCLACINYCPNKAIQYGKMTIKKGRYTNPNISVKEMY